MTVLQFGVPSHKESFKSNLKHLPNEPQFGGDSIKGKEVGGEFNL